MLSRSRTPIVFSLPSTYQCVLVVLEVLHRSLVRLGCMSGGKCAEVFALAAFSVLLARVQTILTGLQLPNHRKVLSMLIFAARNLPRLSRPAAARPAPSPAGLDGRIVAPRRAAILRHPASLPRERIV